jgi:hypothetical protein
VVKDVSVSEPSQSEAGHGPYIRAVGRGIEARDIAVSGVVVRGLGEEVRWARLTLRPDRDEFAGAVVAEATAEWDEESGWSLVLPGGSAGQGILKGLDQLPDPAEVAAWVVVTLTHPELSLSHEYDSSAPALGEEEFRARLARYAAGS